MNEFDKIFIDNYVGLMWGEFHKILKDGNYKIAPLLLAFSIIDANANLCCPDNIKGQSSKKFIWWVNEFLKDKNGNAYPSSELWGFRCGLFHEFSPFSDQSRKNKCLPIIWFSDDYKDKHNTIYKNNLYLSKKSFFEDLYTAGLNLIKILKADIKLNERVAKRLPDIFNVQIID